MAMGEAGLTEGFLIVGPAEGTAISASTTPILTAGQLKSVSNN